METGACEDRPQLISRGWHEAGHLSRAMRRKVLVFHFPDWSAPHICPVEFAARPPDHFPYDFQYQTPKYRPLACPFRGAPLGSRICSRPWETWRGPNTRPAHGAPLGGTPPPASLARASTCENANGPDAGRKDGPGGPVASAGRHDRPCDHAMGAGYAATLSRLFRTRGGASLLALPRGVTEAEP